MELKTYAGAYPVGGDAHVNVPLANFAVEAFALDDGQFVGDKLMPEIGVGKQSDKYYKILKDEFLRAISTGTLRAPKTKANRIEFTISSDSYFAHNYALAAENALEELANADTAIRLRENSVRLVMHGLKLDQEIRIANLVTSISNVGSGVALAGAAKWGDGASDPIADVNTAHAFIRASTGLLPNVAVIDWDTMQVVRRHPAILDMFKYTSGGELTDTQLQQVFKVDRVLVPRGIKNTAAEGQTATTANIWGNVCILAHVGAATGMQSVTFGGRFRWRPEGLPTDFAVVTDIDNRAGGRHVETVETMYWQDEKVIAKELCYTIKDTI